MRAIAGRAGLRCHVTIAPPAWTVSSSLVRPSSIVSGGGAVPWNLQIVPEIYVLFWRCPPPPFIQWCTNLLWDCQKLVIFLAPGENFVKDMLQFLRIVPAGGASNLPRSHSCSLANAHSINMVSNKSQPNLNAAVAMEAVVAMENHGTFGSMPRSVS